MEHRGLRGVEVLGLVVAQHAAAKGDDAPAAVADREHHPVAEAVVALATLGVLDQQAGVDHHLLLQGIGTQVFEQVVPTRWREPQAEVASDFPRQATALEVVHRCLAGRVAAQRLAVELCGGVEQRIERRVGGLAGFLPAAALFAGYLHASGAGQFLDSLGKVQVVVVHDEAEGVAAGTTAEAVIELLVGADREGRGFFLVKRAAGGVVLAGFFQLDA